MNNPMDNIGQKRKNNLLSNTSNAWDYFRRCLYTLEHAYRYAAH